MLGEGISMRLIMRSDPAHSEQIGRVPILYQNVFGSDSHIYLEIQYLLFNSLTLVSRAALSKSVGLHEHEKGIRPAVFLNESDG